MRGRPKEALHMMIYMMLNDLMINKILKLNIKNKITQNKIWRISLPNSTKYIFRPSKTFEQKIINNLETSRSQNYKYYKYYKKQNLKNKIGELAYPIRPSYFGKPNQQNRNIEIAKIQIMRSKEDLKHKIKIKKEIVNTKS